MNLLLGALLVYGIPALLAVGFWLLVRRLIAHWTHRDLMLSLIPKARHVHHSERLLRVFKRRDKPKTDMLDQLKAAYADMLMRLVNKEPDAARRRDMLDRIERTLASRKQ